MTMDENRWAMVNRDERRAIAHPLIIASTSPRRQEFLRLLGIPFDVIPADIDERPQEGEPPTALVARLSREKAQAVAQKVAGLVLAADTIVVMDGRVLGKPRNEDEAWHMLRSLRDRWHRVYTAVTLLDARGQDSSCGGTAVEMTRVKMRAYSDAEIAHYIRHGNPLDKAGGYAIQDVEFRPVERVEGCMANVMGLPIRRVLELLEGCGVEKPADPTRACKHIFGWCCMEGEKAHVFLDGAGQDDG